MKHFFVFLIIAFFVVPTVYALAGNGLFKASFSTKGFCAESKEPLSMVGQTDVSGVLLAQKTQLKNDTLNPSASLNADDSSSSRENFSPSISNAIEGKLVGHMQKGNIDVSIAFNIRNSAQLDNFIANSEKQAKGQEPVLSEQQFEADYSPTKADYERVIAFLSAHDLAVTQTFSNRLLLTAQGSVNNVQQAFGTTIGLFSYMNATFYNGMGSIVLPTSLNSYGIAGINVSNFSLTPALSRAAEKTSDAISPNNIAFNSSPQDFRDAYGTTQAIESGCTGSGETIGIVDAYGDSSISNDVSLFDSLFSLPSLSLTISGTGGSNSGWATETAIDVEWAHAMAPGAAILLQLSKDNSGTNLFGAINNLVQMQNPPNAISLSWGGLESGSDTLYSSIFAAAAAKGIKVYVSTGDLGAYNGQSELTVQYPASDPNVIAVGGTTLYYNTVQGTNEYYEYGWSGSGGGYSSYFSEPSYQTSAGIPDPTGARAIPDVSLDANPYSGVTIYVGGVEQTGWGGTSLATPMMAGISAVALNGGWNLNNNVLYSLYTSSIQYDVAFHDIYLSGNNGYYNVQQGWDAVTGLGSIDFQNFANIFYQTGGVTLSAQSISPAIIRAGQSCSLNYTISNPDPNYPLNQIGLGATICLDGTTNEITDPSDNIYVSLPGNVSTQTRPFVTSPSLTPGYYDVMWTVWMGPPGLGNSLSSSGWQIDRLQVISQYQVTFNYQVLGGGSPSPPSVTYISLGSQYTITAGPLATVWADYGSTYTYTPNPLTGLSGSERWQAPNGTSGTVSSSTTIAPVYYHQYQVTASYSTSDGSVPSSAPLLMGTQLGSNCQVALTKTNQTIWLDYNTQWYVTNVTAFLPHSNSPAPNPSPTPPDSPPTLSIFSPTSSTYTQGSSIPLILVYNSSVANSTYYLPVFWNVVNDATGKWVYTAGPFGVGMPDEPYNFTGYPDSFNINFQNLTAGAYTVYAYAGNQYGLTGPVTVTFTIVPPSERWISASDSGTITQAFSLCPTYYHQYTLTVVSSYASTLGSGWYNAGSPAYAGLTSGAVLNGTGTQWAFAGWTTGGNSYQQSNPIIMNSAVTSSAIWDLQYCLTVTSAYGSPSGAGWYNAGTVANFGVTSPFSVSQGEQYAFASWTGSGSGSYSGNSSSASCQMDAPVTESASWGTQYYVTIVSSYGYPTGEGWYNADTLATFGVTTPFSCGSGIQYLLSSWSGSGAGSYSGSAAFNSVTVNNAITETASWTTQYYLTVDNGGYGTATGSGWYDSGSSAQAVISSNIVSGNEGTQYVFAGWTGDVSGLGPTSNSITMNSSETATATWTTQYQLTFLVTPSGSGSTTPTGTNLWVDSGPLSISVTPNSGYSFSQWIANNGSITFGNSNSMSTTANVNGPGTITAGLVANPTSTSSSTSSSMSSSTSSPTSSPTSTLTQEAIWGIAIFLFAVLIAAVAFILRKLVKDKS